jgi:uncharacterized protein
MTIRVLGAFLVASLIVAIGCIRIPDKFEAHIVVEIRHQIENQAEKVLDYVEGRTDTLPVLQPVGSKGSWPRDLIHALRPIQTVYAQELKDESPRVKQIAQSMRERHGELEAIKRQGAVGETNRGYVELRPSDALDDPEAKNAAQRLIAAENNDRKALYQEVARLNRDANVSVSLVETAYAMKRLERAKPGEIFQMPAAGEEFETFKATALGRRLGEALKPGAWVVIP